MALNIGAVNTFAVNDAALNSTPSGIFGVGPLIHVEQQVAKIGSGSLIDIEQTTELRAAGNGSLIDITSSVTVSGSGRLIEIQQLVRDQSIPDHLSRTGWDATLVVGGMVISKDQIVGMVDINRTESTASLMNITIMPPAGTINFDQYMGKTVTFDITTSAGTYRAYTGVVDIPEIDLILEKITLRCTDRRTEQINSQLSNVVNTIGSYSSAIFGDAKDTAELVEQRLSTTPTALDFDAYGNFTLTPWAAKSTADFTLEDDDVYRNKPTLELASRGRVINKVKINFQYRFDRNYHMQRTFSWESPVAGSGICNLLLDGFSLTSKAMVRSAAEGAGWPIRGNISFTELPDAGWYRCTKAGSTIAVAWSPIQLSGTSSAVQDETGAIVKDSNGNDLTEFTRTGGVDYGELYCAGAGWQATKRWAQTITENYSLTVQAPQSQSQFGTIERETSYSLQSGYDSSAWESYAQYTNLNLGTNYSVDRDIERSQANEAIVTAVRQAQTTILEAHRDTRVKIDTFIWPQVDLKHTVKVDTDEIVAKGKVWNIRHTLNISTGEAVTTTTLVLSRAPGSSSTTPISIPSKPSDTQVFPSGNIRLGNHFGEDPTTPAAASWNGMIGNRWVTEANNKFRTTYQEQFIVDTPAIPAQLRDAKNLNGSASYNLEIPNDLLTVVFDGKH